MKLSIEYCAAWGYTDRAVGMVTGLLEEFEHKIEGINLIPSRGGVFEVMADDKLIYSKKETGEHAEYEDAAGPLRELLG